ncbi:MAG: hypothetical protein Fur0023_00010 [Bacteroidia bacterium]
MSEKRTNKKFLWLLALIGLVFVSVYVIKQWANKTIAEEMPFDQVSEQLDDYVIQYTQIELGMSNLRIYRKGIISDKLIYSADSVAGIEDVRAIDLDRDGNKELFMTIFTGGVHCCFVFVAARLENDTFIPLDTIMGGHAEFEITDIDKDSIKEIKGANTSYAYAFASFVDSYYPVQIFQFKKNKFVDVTHLFPQEVKKDMAETKKLLEDFISQELAGKEYACPTDEDDEDWVNHDSTLHYSDKIKAYLAPILEDYYLLNQWDSGVAYVKSVYKCDDADVFIKKVKKVFINNRSKGMVGLPDLSNL